VTKRQSTFLKLAGGVALFAFVLANTEGIAAVGRALLDAAPLYVALSMVVLTIDRFLMTFKWLVLLQARGLTLKLVRGVQIYCSAMLWGLFLPATIGADALRGYMTTRQGLDGYVVFASIAVERLVGFICSLVFGLVGILILSSAAVGDARLAGFAWVGGITAVVAIVALVASFHEGLFRRTLALLPRRAKGSRLVARLEHFHSAYRAYAANGGALFAFVVLTWLEQYLVVVAVWIIALALHIDVSLWFMTGAVPLSLLISRLPVSIDGIGVFEGVMVLAMSLIGVSAADAVALALAGRIIQLFVWLPWWLAYTIETGALRPPKEPVSHPKLS
jgi:uncharacterized protein (TIRG00374 family)